MKRKVVIAAVAVAAVLALAAAALLAARMRMSAGEGPRWRMDASIIAACSCPIYCQCCFNEESVERAGTEGHPDDSHLYRFNGAYKVNRGKYGAVSLDEAKFWMAGDFGSEPGDDQRNWAVLTFDKATTPEQRDAIGAIVSRIFPVKWKSFSTAEGDVEWTDLGSNVRLSPRSSDYAHATLDGGRTAEVSLKRPTTADDPSQPIEIQNLRYWGANSNDGFVLMPAEIQAWRSGDRKFEYRNTNGYTLTFHIESGRARPAPQP